MARATRKTAPTPDVSGTWLLFTLCAAAFLVEVVVLPGTASSFRLPKEAVALGGLGVAVALALRDALRRRVLALPRSALAVVLVALPVLQLASAAWSSSPLRALASAAGTILWVAGALVVATLPAAARRRIVAWAVGGAVLSAAVLLLQAAGVELLPFADTLAGRFRLTGLTGNPADFAIAAVLLLPLLLADGEGWPTWRRPTAVVVLVAATLVTLTTTAYVALAALILAWLVHVRSRRAWVAAVVGLLVATTVALAAGFGGRVERQLSHLREGDWYTFLSARGDGWTAAAQMIREHPLVGVGADNYTQRFFDSRLAWLDRRQEVGRRGELATHFEWAHSDPLQVLAELGVPGLLWMAALGWIILRRWRPAVPLPGYAAAAAAPFLLLHYPTHLAVGALPLTLILGEMLARDQVVELPVRTPVLRTALGLTAVAVAGLGLAWQGDAMRVDAWRATVDGQLDVIRHTTSPAERAQLAAAFARRVMDRIDAHPVAAAWMWRDVGKARLAGGDPAGAAAAFRRATELCPHAEADMGLGLALAAQGRRGEALMYLGRAARVNPSLATLISDPDLRQTVEDLTAARRRR